MATQGSIMTAALPFGCGLCVYWCIFLPSRNAKSPAIARNRIGHNPTIDIAVSPLRKINEGSKGQARGLLGKRSLMSDSRSLKIKKATRWQPLYEVKMLCVLARNGDVTGVLMQCIPRIPLSYRRKTKAPTGGALAIFKLSLNVAAIVAQLCQA
ncbi:hypothetical protein M989_02682 [Kluyvera georgiana ATCC 51603]|uniref:Uncharacterized protein n=1 Tax=Kluyvera georgiana ATCC 51603 TaxID=1354264 RepID=A0A1B7JW92_9ENTR|nr:hypothetical protein [Kluyvera georgiana]OAT52145.1 hypothetical protein M989_02682 [Kluyvera georgiana ATCC 51603]